MTINFQKQLRNSEIWDQMVAEFGEEKAEQLLKESNRVIENTIRQIKESQAEKEKTKDLRQQLDEFKTSVVEEIKPVETKTEEKISILSSRVKKISRRPE